MYPIASTFTSQSAGSVLLDIRDITGLRPDRTLNDYGVVYSTKPVTWGRKPGGGSNCDRCCLVIPVQKVKPFARKLDSYVERIDCPTAPQHPHRGRDCQRRASPAGFIAPCLPIKTTKVPYGGQWLHEIKHDGFRMLVRRDAALVFQKKSIFMVGSLGQ